MVKTRPALALLFGAVCAALASASASTAVEAHDREVAAEAETFLREQFRARGEKVPPDDLIAETIRSALSARRQFPWGERVPAELFLRYVLPEVNLTEPPTLWRIDLSARLAPLVEGARTAGEAAVRLNDGMWKLLGVGYDARPPRKPDLPPAQAVRRGRVSCTSLAILLVDACRAFGIPARVAGIPSWVVPADDPRARGGYHQWVEVWDGSWRSLSAIDSSALDAAWFAERAARTDLSRAEHRIYAASFAATGSHFPLPWAPQIRTVPGIDVTALYTSRRALKFEMPAGARLSLRRDGELFAIADGAGQELFLGAGESYDWIIIDAGGRELGRGELALDGSTPARVRLLTPPSQPGSGDGSSASQSRTSSPFAPHDAHFATDPR